MCLMLLTLSDACGSQNRVSEASVLELRDGYVLPYRCWEPNPDPMQEQQVLLNNEASLKPQTLFLCISHLRDMNHYTIFNLFESVEIQRVS